MLFSKSLPSDCTLSLSLSLSLCVSSPTKDLDPNAPNKHSSRKSGRKSVASQPADAKTNAKANAETKTPADSKHWSSKHLNRLEEKNHSLLAAKSGLEKEKIALQVKLDAALYECEQSEKEREGLQVSG